MSTAQTGNTVKVHYTGKLTDGTVFDSSEGREPLEFTLGSGMVIAGFEFGVTNMKIGEKKTVNIPVTEAYGPHNPEMLLEFPKSQLPADMPVEIGTMLQMSDDQGHVHQVILAEIKDETVIIDANHALAGKDLVFDLELVAIL
jgi:FKBP-type peptidyl-prolyl cis-trans isomerase 2